MGSFLAFDANSFSWNIVLLAVLTTILLQVLSNLANDYGDTKKGTDNENRVGPTRAVQSGVISLAEMKVAIVITSISSLISGVLLIYFGLKGLSTNYLLLFLVIGLGAIAAAIKYTMGKNPYGYAGLGDVFVFIFFGLVGVIGSYFLHTHQFDWPIILPAVSIGLLSTAVLNMNNMRDIKNDKASNKNTLVVIIGKEKARFYQTFLVLGALSAITLFIFLTPISKTTLLCFITLPIFGLNLKKTWSFKDEKELDPELKKIALGTFAFTLLFGAGIFL